MPVGGTGLNTKPNKEARMSDLIIAHSINGLSIGLRKSDGYINATRLTQAYKEQTGKRRDVNDWIRLKRTKEMLDHLSTNTGIPANQLYQAFQGSPDNGGGTWLHPKLATRFAIWLSDDFGLMVETWVEEWMTQKSQPQSIDPLDALIEGLKETKRLRDEMELLKQQVILEAQKNDQLSELVKQHDAELERIHKPCGDYYTVMGYARLKGINSISLETAKNIGRQASAKCRQLGLPIEHIRDPRFGNIGCYPEGILNELL